MGPSQEAGSHHQRQASQQNLGEPSPASHPTTQGSPVSHSATAGADAAQNYHPQQHYTSQPNGGAQKNARSTPQRSLQHQNSGDRLGLSFLLDQRQNEDKRSAASTPTDIPAYARFQPTANPHVLSTRCWLTLSFHAAGFTLPGHRFRRSLGRNTRLSLLLYKIPLTRTNSQHSTRSRRSWLIFCPSFQTSPTYLKGWRRYI